MLQDYLQLPTLVRILCLGSLINRAGSFVTVFLAIYASEQLGLGVPFATACLGVFGLGAMVGSMAGGQIADQLGRRFVMLLALFGGAGVLMVLSQLQNPWLFMLAIGVFAMVSEMYRPAASAMIADVVPANHRPHAFALMYISINLGFAIAPAVGGVLAEYSFALLFWGDAITMAIYGMIILLSVKETLPSQRGESATEQSATGEAVAEELVAGGVAESIPLRGAIREMSRDLPFVGFCVAGFLMALVFMQCVSTLPIYIKQCGFSNAEYGLLMSVNGVLIVLFQLPMTHWLSRFNPVTMVLLGGVLIAIGFGSIGLGTSAWVLALSVIIWTSGEIVQSPFTHAIISDLAPLKLRARYLGLHSMCGCLAITVGAPIGGAILTAYGPQKFWGLMFAVAACAVLMYVAIHASVTARIAGAGTDEELASAPAVVDEPLAAVG